MKKILLLIAISFTFNSFNQITETVYSEKYFSDSIHSIDESQYGAIQESPYYSKAKHTLLVNYKTGYLKFIRTYNGSENSNVAKAIKKFPIALARKINDDYQFIAANGYHFVFNSAKNIVYNDELYIRKFEGFGLQIKVIETVEYFLANTQKK